MNSNAEIRILAELQAIRGDLAAHERMLQGTTGHGASRGYGGGGGGGGDLHMPGLPSMGGMGRQVFGGSLALAGVTGIAGIFNMIERGMSAFAQHGPAVEALYRQGAGRLSGTTLGTAGTSGELDTLRDNVLRRGLQFGYNRDESLGVAQILARSGGTSGFNDASSRLDTPMQFARMMGIGWQSSAQTFGGMERMGAIDMGVHGPRVQSAFGGGTLERMDSSQLADVFAAGIDKSKMRGREEEFLGSITGVMSSLSARLVDAPDVRHITGMMTALNATGVPGLRGAGAEAIVSGVDKGITGASGGRSQLLYSLYRRQNPNMSWADFLFEQENGVSSEYAAGAMQALPSVFGNAGGEKGQAVIFSELLGKGLDYHQALALIQQGPEAMLSARADAPNGQMGTAALAASGRDPRTLAAGEQFNATLAELDANLETLAKDTAVKLREALMSVTNQGFNAASGLGALVKAITGFGLPNLPGFPTIPNPLDAPPAHAEPAGPPGYIEWAPGDAPGGTPGASPGGTPIPPGAVPAPGWRPYVPGSGQGMAPGVPRPPGSRQGRSPGVPRPNWGGPAPVTPGAPNFPPGFGDENGAPGSIGPQLPPEVPGQGATPGGAAPTRRARDIARISQSDPKEYSTFTQAQFDKWSGSTCSAAAFTAALRAMGMQIDVGQVTDWLIDQGGITVSQGLISFSGDPSGDLNYWLRRAADHFGVTTGRVNTGSVSAMRAAVDANQPFIVSGLNSTFPQGHFIGVTGFENGRFTVTDSSRLNMKSMSPEELQGFTGGREGMTITNFDTFNAGGANGSPNIPSAGGAQPGDVRNVVTAQGNDITDIINSTARAHGIAPRDFLALALGESSTLDEDAARYTSDPVKYPDDNSFGLFQQTARYAPAGIGDRTNSEANLRVVREAFGQAPGHVQLAATTAARHIQGYMQQGISFRDAMAKYNGGSGATWSNMNRDNRRNYERGYGRVDQDYTDTPGASMGPWGSGNLAMSGGGGNQQISFSPLTVVVKQADGSTEVYSLTPRISDSDYFTAIEPRHAGIVGAPMGRTM